MTILLYSFPSFFISLTTLLHGDVLMWLMKTLLTSGCTNQRGAGQSEGIHSQTTQIRGGIFAKQQMMKALQRINILVIAV
ncbi:hypothetical protein C4L14_17580 [Enterobacter sp. RC4]|nr:hypothetical protein C4L14_17580 [Enterobacter sp. RC4]